MNRSDGPAHVRGGIALPALSAMTVQPAVTWLGALLWETRTAAEIIADALLLMSAPRTLIVH